MRGYFAIGAEGLSKQRNLGNLMRTAHAFGASFVFTIGGAYERRHAYSDTSQVENQVPLYEWASAENMALPKGCQIVGIELLDEAIELPSFRHPSQAAYVLGPEKGALSKDILSRADFVLKIPTSFCVNVAIAGAIVMYDRLLTMKRHAERPLLPGGPRELRKRHLHGGRFTRKRSPVVER